MSNKFTNMNDQQLLEYFIEEQNYDAILLMLKYTTIVPNKLYDHLPPDILNILYEDNKWTEEIFMKGQDTSYRHHNIHDYFTYLDLTDRYLSTKSICNIYYKGSRKINDRLVVFINDDNINIILETVKKDHRYSFKSAKGELIEHINNDCNIHMSSMSVDNITIFLNEKRRKKEMFSSEKRKERKSMLEENMRDWIQQNWNVLYELDLDLLASWCNDVDIITKKLVNIKLIVDNKLREYNSINDQYGAYNYGTNDGYGRSQTEDEYTLMIELGRTEFIKKYLKKPKEHHINRFCELGLINNLPYKLQKSQITSIMHCQNTNLIESMLKRMPDKWILNVDEAMQCMDAPLDNLIKIVDRLPSLMDMWKQYKDIHLLVQLYDLPHDFIHANVDDSWTDIPFSECCYPYIALRTQELYKSIPQDYLNTSILILLSKPLNTIIEEFTPVPEPLRSSLEHNFAHTLDEHMPTELAVYYSYHLTGKVWYIRNGKNKTHFIVNYLLTDPVTLDELPNIYTIPNTDEGYECMRHLTEPNPSKIHLDRMYKIDDIDLFKKLGKMCLNQASLSTAVTRKAKRISKFIVERLVD